MLTSDGLLSNRSLDMKPDKNIIDKVNALDLEPISFKLVASCEGPRWTQLQASHAEKWYRRFLVLNLHYPHKTIVPTKAIDEFWHHHLLDSQKYHEDSEFLFGGYFHHFPYLGLRGEEDARCLNAAFRNTLLMFRNMFGADPLADESKIFLANGDIGSICGGDCGRGCGKDDMTESNFKQTFASPSRPTLGASYMRQVA